MGILEDPTKMMTAHSEVEAMELTGLGMYVVLGAFDIVTSIEAPDNRAATRYSLQLGVRIGAHTQTPPGASALDAGRTCG